MAAQPAELLVIGGGITGAGIARDAAMRGIRTCLVDKGDFGSGASSRTSRLVHGGLRYLELGDWHLVFEASRERRALLRIAPHLVRPQTFVFPIHAGGRVSLLRLATGLALYDILALFRNVRRHQIVGKRRMLRLEPNLRSRGLKGGGVYFDALCDDARLTLCTVRSAHTHGALVANYVSVDDLDRADGRVCGARITDRINNTSYVVHADAIVNATGAWSDDLRRWQGEAPVLLRTRGAHVMVPRERLGNNEAITLTSPIDGRVIFIIPWGEFAYIGTTDTEDNSNPDLAAATGEDVIYLLRSANAYFPRARLSPDDVVSTWAGIRPLFRAGDTDHPSAVSREHRIIEGDSGLISVLGGKLSTHRTMAREVVDLLAARLHKLDGRRIAKDRSTDKDPLPGGEVRDLDVLIADVVREGFPTDVAEYLVHCYGTETAAVVRIAQSDPEWARPIVGGHPAIRAQLLHALQREMAVTLSDLMMRRTRLFHEVLGHGVPEAPGIVDLAAQELGWDGGRKASELASYLEAIQHGMAFREVLSA